MRQIALVSLDCETGRVNRYISYGEGPEFTGFQQIEGWDPRRTDVNWGYVWDFLQYFRKGTGYFPPLPPEAA